MTPRTDTPFHDMATGAHAYLWCLLLFGFYLTVTQCPTRSSCR